ncbi:MAG: DUF4136 domain-containing protein [Thermoanaerobaculales bacterium]
MRRIFLAIVVLAVVGFGLSCSSTRVQADFDHQADFGKYSTFALYVQAEKDKPPTTGANQIVDGRIRRAITEEIIGKGFSQTSPENADLLVTYYTSLSSQLRMFTTGWGYGWGYGGGFYPYWGFGYGYWPGWGYSGTYTYHEGTIIVDIVDRGKRQLVWRGVISSVLNKKSSSEEKIDKSIARVMLAFPPA